MPIMMKGFSTRPLNFNIFYNVCQPVITAAIGLELNLMVPSARDPC